MTEWVECDDCGQKVMKVPYHPDLSKTPPKGYLTRVPLDPRPAADQDDSSANYAVSIGRTWCHLITHDWPLDAVERRHHVHPYTCPARRRALAGGSGPRTTEENY